MNAVACEVAVIATGARPGEKGGQRELFTEETTTALVFENGGVLRLAAAVVPGQLLFLTQKETKREVVAQVTRKRDFRPMMCYVEVEFSEPAQGFWGIEFPKVQAVAPAAGSAHTPQKIADEAARVREDILAGEPAEPTEAPSAEEISALKDEVEVLREQLKLLQTQIVGGKPAGAGASAAGAVGAAENVPVQAPVADGGPGEQLLKMLGGAGEATQAARSEVSSGPASAHAVVAPTPALVTPQAKASEQPFDEEELLPKPALDFKNAKPAAKAATAPRQRVAASSGSATMRKDLLFAAFVIVTAAAAWYQNLLPWLSHPKNSSASTAPSSVAPSAPHPTQKTTSAPTDVGKSSKGGDAAATAASADSHEAPQTGSSVAGKSSIADTPETPAASKTTPDATTEATVPKRTAVAASAGKRAAVPTLSKAAMVSPEGRSAGAAIVPPKLIKSVKAVASPSALQDFGEGSADNVRFDALVDVSGHVKSMKALSGPPALQRAAMEALKQYVYEPATNQGKPVAAHVTVTVKFLFEP